MVLRRSKYLQIIKDRNKTYGYNSLFGNLRQLSKKELEIIKNSNDIPPKKNNCIKALESKFFLVENDIDVSEIIPLVPETSGQSSLFTQESGMISEHVKNHPTKGGASKICHPPQRVVFNERAIFEQRLEQRKKLIPSGSLIHGIQLNISDLCNFACAYCYAPKNKDKKEKLEKKRINHEKLMPFETARDYIEKIIKIFKGNGNKNLGIRFFGREPLLNWGVIEQILDYFGKGEEYGINIYYCITTNGSLISDRIAKKMKEYDFKVSVSIDGVNEGNDNSRVTLSGEKTFGLIEFLFPPVYSEAMTGGVVQ